MTSDYGPTIAPHGPLSSRIAAHLDSIGAPYSVLVPRIVAALDRAAFNAQVRDAERVAAQYCACIFGDAPLHPVGIAPCAYWDDPEDTEASCYCQQRARHDIGTSGCTFA